MMEPKWSEKEIEFDVDMMDVEYLGNENLICHVWDNLLSNAIKFKSLWWYDLYPDDAGRRKDPFFYKKTKVPRSVNTP
mgnify:CR=1 FL=1